MSTYTDASLIMFPSGYKEDKIYSLKPTDGSGDLTFTRASTATRVNAEGLIEEASVIGSELVTNGDFSNSGTSWSVSGENATHIATFNGSTLRYQSDTTSPQLIVAQGSVLESGKIYKITIDVDTLTSGSLKSDSLDGLNITPSVGVSVFYATATGTTFNITRATTDVDITINSISIKEVITLNVPRIDYTGGGCGKLLLEPQRTNLVTYSEQFDNAGWAQTRGTITANATTSPDGTINADLWAQNTGETTAAALLQNISVTSGTDYSLSVFAKKQNKNFLGIRANSVSSIPSYFDLENGTLGTINPLHTAKIEDYGNGWYRCSISYTTTSTSAGNIFYPADGSSLTVTDSGGIYLWGAQLEAGSYVSSYIPTLASSVTRLADSAFKTGISSLIGQTEGTIFVDAANLFISGLRTIALFYTSGSAFYQILINASNQVRVDVNGSFLFLGGSIAENTNYKIAFAYKSGEYALYINGTQIATSASTTMPSSLTSYYLGNSFGGEQSGAYKQALLFPTRLSNAELATLTTI